MVIIMWWGTLLCYAHKSYESMKCDLMRLVPFDVTPAKTGSLRKYRKRTASFCTHTFPSFINGLQGIEATPTENLAWAGLFMRWKSIEYTLLSTLWKKEAKIAPRNLEHNNLRRQYEISHFPFTRNGRFHKWYRYSPHILPWLLFSTDKAWCIRFAV